MMPTDTRVRRWLGFFWLAAILFAAMQAQAQSPPALVSPAAEAVSLDGHLDVLFDPTRALPFDEVRSPKHADDFHPVGRKSFAKALREGTVWIRFRIENPSNESLLRFLHIHNNQIDEVEAFLFEDDGSYHRYQAGENTEISSRLIPVANPTFPLSLSPHQQKTHYLRFYAEGALAARLQIETWPRIVADAEQQNSMSGFLWGIFSGVRVLYLFLYPFSRNAVWLVKPKCAGFSVCNHLVHDRRWRILAFVSRTSSLDLEPNFPVWAQHCGRRNSRISAGTA